MRLMQSLIGDWKFYFASSFANRVIEALEFLRMRMETTHNEHIVEDLTRLRDELDPRACYPNGKVMNGDNLAEVVYSKDILVDLSLS